MSVITVLLPRNVYKLHWQSKFFSVPSWSNKAPFCYVCWVVPKCVPTNSVHIRYFIRWIEINVQDVNFLKGGSWLYRLLTKTTKTTGDYLLVRLWTHHGEFAQNRISTNPELTIINTYRLLWYSWVIFLTMTFQFAHCFLTISNI